MLVNWFENEKELILSAWKNKIVKIGWEIREIWAFKLWAYLWLKFSAVTYCGGSSSHVNVNITNIFEIKIPLSLPPPKPHYAGK